MESVESQPLLIVPLAVTLSAFFAVTFLLCLVAGLILPTAGMRMMLESVQPSFFWLSSTSVIAGLFWAAAFARDIPAQPVPIRNLDYRRFGQARQMR